jgi:hypothetical protein
MSHISSIKEMVNAELDGKIRTNNWRKVASQTTTQGIWFDLSLSPGNPVPKYWFDAPPGVAKAISQSADGGLFHGANVSPSDKYLRKTTWMSSSITGLPVSIVMCDYLLYYPSIDESVTDPQVLDNTVTLPRYTDGEGVQVIAVTLAGRTGGQSFYFTYTNSDGVSGRTSQTVTQNALASLGIIATSSTATLRGSGNPFIGLQDGDTGVRSIESVTMLGADVGLFALILVKPIGQTQLIEQTSPVEKDYFMEGSSIPIIQDDAFLNWLCCPNASLATWTLMGDLTVTWN